jgi:ketopantoate reductase
VLCRREEHARALNATGLRVSGQGRASCACRGASRADAAEPDLVIVATKAHGLEARLASLAGTGRDAP